MNQYCLISLKTLGYSSSRLRISEICLASIHENKISIDLHEYLKHDSLLKRGHTRSNAKYFHEIAKRIVELTQEKVLVSEDAYLECTFLKKEFLSLGYSFNVKTLSLKNFLPEIQHDDRSSCGDKIEVMFLRLKQVFLNQDNRLIATKIQRKIPAPAQFDEQTLKQLPHQPGVYFFKDKHNQIIYVGKAKNLAKRVPHHLNFNPERSKHLEFKSLIASLDYEICSSENEAVLLEIYLIKKWIPIFNRTLKTRTFNFGIFFDDKSQVYTCRRHQENECPIRTVRSKRSAQRLIDYFERERLKPIHLEFQESPMVMNLSPECMIEIRQKRFLDWKHSETLDLNSYPEIKWELLKIIRNGLRGSGVLSNK